jgi:hypothetical protein
MQLSQHTTKGTIQALQASTIWQINAAVGGATKSFLMPLPPPKNCRSAMLLDMPHVPTPQFSTEFRRRA